MNLKEWKSINQKMVIMIVAFCAVFIITTAGLVVYYTSIIGNKDDQIRNLDNEAVHLNAEVEALNAKVDTLNTTVAQKNTLISQKNDEITSLNSQIASLNSQIADLEELTGQTRKSTLVADDLTAEDVRSSTPYALRVYGIVKNTGGGTAYNAVLHILAFNAEGVAIDTYHAFGGITAGMSLGLSFSVNYGGSPIQSWLITPIWTDQVTPVSGTFPP